MSSGIVAIVRQVAVLVDVQTVKARRQAFDGTANDYRSTCRRLLKIELSSDTRELARSFYDCHR